MFKVLFSCVKVTTGKSACLIEMGLAAVVKFSKDGKGGSELLLLSSDSAIALSGSIIAPT